MSNEEIVQIITLFRHGKRNSFINLETNILYPTDLCPKNIQTTIDKGHKFIKKYIPLNNFSFNSKEFGCNINESIRTIKSILYRLIDYFPKLILVQ